MPLIGRLRMIPRPSRPKPAPSLDPYKAGYKSGANDRHMMDYDQPEEWYKPGALSAWFAGWIQGYEDRRASGKAMQYEPFYAELRAARTERKPVARAGKYRTKKKESTTVSTLPERALWRAMFQGPKFKPEDTKPVCRADITVEVYPETRTRWRARVLPTRGELPDVKEPTPEQAQRKAARWYIRQLSEWKPYDIRTGEERDKPRPALTHLMSHNERPLKHQDSVRAACGKIVPRRAVISDPLVVQCDQCRLIGEQDRKREAAG